MINNNQVIEQYRIKTGPMASNSAFGNNGLFLIQGMRIICSDGMGWDHVSVSLETRTPTWEEMCFIKDLFFAEDETVIQYHPKKAVYKNLHPYCLHLWKKKNIDFETPPGSMI